MSDDETFIKGVKEAVKNFCEIRDWGQFHGAKDLAIGISTEASEILEHFRFKTSGEIERMFNDAPKREEIEDEMADVLFFLFRFAQKYDVDLSKAFERKLKKATEKYPVDKSKGNSIKYTEL